ncbi:hypothetical protein E4U54_005898 [Claviceps lovelessii]|nr:hypothetical protein E4U54_005898 [Claviceps lovelessii]
MPSSPSQPSLAEYIARTGPASPSPDSPPRALQTPHLLAEVAHRAAKTDVFPARDARSPAPRRIQVIHSHRVMAAAAEPRATILARTRR